jgi:hypothetical protein
MQAWSDGPPALGEATSAETTGKEQHHDIVQFGQRSDFQPRKQSRQFASDQP